MSPNTHGGERRGLCTFWLADHCFGVDVLGVQEVIRHQEVTPVPLAPQVVVGLMNLRGQIITSCDLRIRMELGERPADIVPMNVVLRTADGPISLLVDRIGDVIEVADEDFEAPPSTVTGVAGELIIGAYKLDGRLLLELDTIRLVDGLAALVDA
jgi:purine-binding chemotaxis protein CheW